MMAVAGMPGAWWWLVFGCILAAVLIIAAGAYSLGHRAGFADGERVTARNAVSWCKCGHRLGDHAGRHECWSREELVPGMGDVCSCYRFSEDLSRYGVGGER